jgi:transposase-like protein
MLNDSQPPRYSVPRTRRTYSPQFKAELLTACKQPGASIAALALQHGMNANVLHRWLKDHRQGTLLLSDGASAPAFIPIDLAAAQPVLGSDAEPAAPPSNIRIELQHHAMKVILHWPVDAAGACAQMLRALLR